MKKQVKMNPNELSFESQNLVVDYISFKFQDLDNPTRMQIADYLFKIGFNSYQESGKLAQPIKEPILISPENKFEVLFVVNNFYWQGTLLNFSGFNAQRFYCFIKEELISWKLFSSATLGRFDIYYSRDNKREDKNSVQDFFENCHRKLKQENKKVIYENNSKGLILKIGSRKSNRYFRIYQLKGINHLKFEQEMKGKFLQKYHLLLVENRLEELEQKLSSNFLIYFGKLLPLKYCFTDWLVTKLRPSSKQRALPYGLNSDYISSEILMDTTSFVMLLQFLNYARDLDYEIEYLGKVAYRQVSFKLRHFLEFQNPTIKSNNHYQLEKLKDFFRQLQAGLYVTTFSDKYFQSLVIVPQVDFERCPKEKFLIAKVWLVEELFYYNYPFYLPNFFQQKLTKHELQVRAKLFRVFASVSIEKEVLVHEFFESYPSVLNNRQKTKIKKSFIESVKLLEKYGLIESRYKIMSNGSLYDTQELTIKNISEGFVIYEKLFV